MSGYVRFGDLPVGATFSRGHGSDLVFEKVSDSTARTLLNNSVREFSAHDEVLTR